MSRGEARVKVEADLNAPGMLHQGFKFLRVHKHLSHIPCMPDSAMQKWYGENKIRLLPSMNFWSSKRYAYNCGISQTEKNDMTWIYMEFSRTL